MKGLHCYIYDSPLGNSSNHGISSRCQRVTLVGPGIDEVFNATPDAPAVRLVRRDIGGTEYLHVEPVDPPAGLIGPMFGGAFVYTSDSRFPSRYPLPLHDRFDTQELYDALSR